MCARTRKRRRGPAQALAGLEHHARQPLAWIARRKRCGFEPKLAVRGVGHRRLDDDVRAIRADAEREIDLEVVEPKLNGRTSAHPERLGEGFDEQIEHQFLLARFDTGDEREIHGQFEPAFAERTHRL